VVFQSYGAEVVDTREHRLLSLAVAQQAMTLLKNDAPAPKGGGGGGGGKSGPSSVQAAAPLLPLKIPTAGKLAVALLGPQANFTLEMLSNYEGQNKLALNHSTLMAAQRIAGLTVSYEPGHSLDVSSTDASKIPAAVAAAKAADVAVVMVGLCADHCAGNGRTENEGNDRVNGTGWHTLGLPGAQEQLLEAVLAVQPSTVLVMINGGMLDISWAKGNVPAILEAYCACPSPLLPSPPQL
jgi:beta-glucosidase